MDVMLDALSHFAPERAVAQSGGSGGPTAITWEPASAGERSLLQYEIFGTGWAATTAPMAPAGSSFTRPT